MKQNMKFLKELIEEKYPNTAALIIMKDQEVIHEQYFQDYQKEHTLHVYSVTKSILSILIGIAIDKGYLKGVDQTLQTFYPELAKRDCANITIRDMLRMCVPYRYEEEPYIEYFTSDSYVDTALRYLGKEGDVGTFRYAPMIGPDILSGILVKTTGTSVLEFARTWLFSPLGIHIEKSIVFQSEKEQYDFQQSRTMSGWVQDAQGIHTAGWGLTLSAMDMAKLGQLYLQKGDWQGSQIVSSHWVEESTKEQSRWDQMNLAYGYLWWVMQDGFAAMGDGGNVIYVNRKKHLVVCMQCMFAPNATDRVELIEQTIIPLFENEDNEANTSYVL